MGDTGINTLWKRPENGTYYFRKGVPERLRPLVGKTMMQISLRTRDLSIAKARHRTVAAGVAAQWAALGQAEAPLATAGFERPTVAISSRDCAALAGELYATVLAKHRDDAGVAKDWEAKLRQIQIALPVAERLPDAPKWTFGGPSAIRQNAIVMCHANVEALLIAKGVSVSMADMHRLCSHAVKALAQAYEVLIRRANGDWSPDLRAGRFPSPISFTGWKQWYPDYCSAKLPEPSSRKRQEGVLNAFFEYLGHDIPARVTADDAIKWMEARLKLVSHSTVRKADVAHPRSFFTWAKSTKRLPSNPFAEIVVPSVAKKVLDDKSVVPMQDKREYHLGEARKILEATLDPVKGNLSAHGKAARRWVPWLCAYTGARVGEITQLRKQDVYEALSMDESRRIWVIGITPEAGRVKDHQAREVAIHPHLIEQGFLDFVKASETETLFYDARRHRGGSSANPQSAKAGEGLARWIRQDLKITDPTISPNHAWRHRFRSLLMDRVFPQILDGIDGHAPATVGHKYGKVWPEVSLAAVSLIEPYRFDGREIVSAPGAG